MEPKPNFFLLKVIKIEKFKIFNRAKNKNLMVFFCLYKKRTTNFTYKYFMASSSDNLSINLNFPIRSNEKEFLFDLNVIPVNIESLQDERIDYLNVGEESLVQ